VAERLATCAEVPFTYLATMEVGDDPELAARVEEHLARRPPSWRTEEAGSDLPRLLRELEGPVLLDGLGGWVATSEGMDVDTGSLCSALRERSGDTLVVSEEVGLGVHPSTDAGRRFRDVLGELNQAVAEVADEVLLVVAGRVLPLKELRADPTGLSDRSPRAQRPATLANPSAPPRGHPRDSPEKSGEGSGYG
jgi:adenosylcobinamide kinase / adenosylcobinamide-phosphate guanylyltransferase